MKLKSTALALLAATAISGCVETFDGGKNITYRTIDQGFDDKHLSQRS